ncbi:MAG: N-acetylneuraminate synthase family protein [Rhodospirillales bacterium]
MKPTLNFIERIVALDHPYMIAEIGINHNGDMNLARDMIDAAAENGADCVKFQNFVVDKYISPLAGKADYQQQDDVADKTQNEIIKACEITVEQAAELRDYSATKNVDFLSTPFEVWSLRGLLSIELPGIKISSCNLTNIPFLEEAAASGAPILLSTGMGSIEEVARAVGIFKAAGSPLLVFQCTSNYPSRPENANLRVIDAYRKLFDVPVGLSDHTPTNTTCIAAVALGAVAIEKHFTLSRDLPGIDQKASIEPHELRTLVDAMRECRTALGSAVKFRTDEEENTAVALRRSLVAARDLDAGAVLGEDDFNIMRPGNGLSPDMAARVVGRKLTRSIKTGTPFTLDDFLTA